MNDELRQVVDDLAREVTGSLYPDKVVRRNCAFCGRERSTRDDNHAPECFYWTLFSEEK